MTAERYGSGDGRVVPTTRVRTRRRVERGLGVRVPARGAGRSVHPGLVVVAGARPPLHDEAGSVVAGGERS